MTVRAAVILAFNLWTLLNMEIFRTINIDKTKDTAVVDLEKRVSTLEANKQYAADKVSKI